MVYSRNETDHCQHVKLVLEKLGDYHLYLKVEKCSFHQKSLQFLGYNISPVSIRMDEGKEEAVRAWPTPTTIKELQRFLGFTNFYRQFIRNYSSLTAPLTSLLKSKPKSLSWAPESSYAFQHPKDAFTVAPLLVHSDPSRPFVVEVDASINGIGAILSQQQGKPSRLHPCAYFSKKLSPA
ncbi:uncharacterized protein LOC127424054 [Myxocyprinus asiaticus]|uniref:uncharacterized protein LOC127424054 n=1 Tax=Myxocyprinus asiaticus TaxID=70543 RepID=UPI002221EAF5|nr:uncharacterized protein LOC127424054 [Myxocyprinus asiaticus]